MENVFASRNKQMQQCYPFGKNRCIQRIKVCKKNLDNSQHFTHQTRI